MEANNWLLPKWFELVRSRGVVLPRFQRHEAWSHGQVQDLMNTVLTGLPCGALLTFEKGDADLFISRPLETAPADGDRISHYLLDGQQRLTAMWRSLHNNYEDRSYYIWIGDETSPASIRSEGRYLKKGQRYPLWADQPEEVWQRGLIPLDLLCPGNDSEVKGIEWRNAASAGDQTVALNISDYVSRFRNAVATFNIPLLSLPRSTDAETALDVFVKMNTSASPLTTFDIMVAQIEAATGESLHELIIDLKREVPGLSRYYSPSKLVLYVTSLMLDSPSTRASQRGEKFAHAIVEHFADIVSGSKRAVTFLEQEGLFDNKRLPTDVVVPALVYLWSKTPEGLDSEGRARALMQRYIWRAFCTRRYENSTASKVHADVQALLKLIQDPSAESPLIFDDEVYPLPDLEELQAAKWPVKRDRLARSILAIALHSGARDFADDQPISRDNIQRREYHHLFPRDWLKNNGRTSVEIDRALNCALLTWRTNRNIAAKAPTKYLAERLSGQAKDDEILRQRLHSHKIPFDAIQSESYDEFIAQRAELVREAMVLLCSPDGKKCSFDKVA